MRKSTLMISAALLLGACAQKIDWSELHRCPPTPQSSTPKKWIVSTLAGSGTAGFVDGDTTQAEFSNILECLALDGQGNLYVGDVANASVRMVTPAGMVSTYAGRTVGNPNPLFGNIYGIVADKSGDLFDMEAGFIREILPGGTNSLQFAGNMAEYYRDGQGTASSFNITANMTIDSSGNIYVPDYDMTDTFRLRVISPSGSVATAPLQISNWAVLNGAPDYHYLYAIAYNPKGGLYMTANGNSQIWKIDPQGVVSFFVGSSLGFQDGQGSAAMFNTILGLACDTAGNVYVSDGNNAAIRKVTPDGTVSTIAGLGSPGYADGDSSQAKFNNPFGIAVNNSGVVYVVDNGNYRIRKLEYK